MIVRRLWTVGRHRAHEIEDRARRCNEVVTLEVAR